MKKELPSFKLFYIPIILIYLKSNVNKMNNSLTRIQLFRAFMIVDHTKGISINKYKRIIAFDNAKIT
mgnify:CR=1 FL=1